MKFYLFLSIIILGVSMSGCSIVESEQNLEPIESNIIFSVTYDSTGIIQNHSGYLLLLKTEKIYGCSNFKLKSAISLTGNKILLGLMGIEREEICLTALGPATSIIPINISSGIFYFDIAYKSKKDKYSLQIDNMIVSVDEIESSFTSYNKFNFDF